MGKVLKVAVSDKKILQQILSEFPEVKCVSLPKGKDTVDADIVLVADAEVPELAERLDAHTSVFVYCQDGKKIPASVTEGLADDFLLLPMQSLDFLRLVRAHQFVLAKKELELSIRDIPRTLKKMQDDLRIAQKVQRSLIKDKFPSMSGISVKSKYFCGLRAGGDYFDVFELPFGNFVGVLMSDSSSYALSNRFIHSLMDLSLGITAEDALSPDRVIARLYEKLAPEMKPEEKLSVFFGLLDKNNFCLRYVSAGHVFASHVSSDGGVKPFVTGGEPSLTKDSAPKLATHELTLEPEDRVVFFSDGWPELVKGFNSEIQKILTKKTDAQELVNQLSYRLHASAPEAEPEADAEGDDFFPEQDCSLVVMDIAKNILRLAR